LNVELPPDLKKKLKIQAATSGVTLKELSIKVLLEYAEKIEKMKRSFEHGTQPAGVPVLQ